MNNRKLGLVCNFRLRMTQEWQARISGASKNMFYITFSSALKTQQCPLEQKNAVLKQNVARDISVCLSPGCDIYISTCAYQFSLDGGGSTIPVVGTITVSNPERANGL